MVRQDEQKLSIADKRRIEMKLSAPKNITWLIAVILGVLGLLGNFVDFGISGFSFWLVFLGFAILAVATFIEGL
jgi:hypothetical protein